MTSTLSTSDAAPASPTRRVLAAVAILATLPYLLLKLHWISGGRAGLQDADFGHSTAMWIGNAVTFAMEACALLLALAFVSRWGRRLPSYVVLLPMWVASGLLGGILVILPFQLLLGWAGGAIGQGAASERPAAPIADWVFAMVYGCFAVLGVSLLLGFALYARDRWLRPCGWPRRLRDLGAVDPAVRRAALAAAGACLVVAAGEFALGPKDGIAWGNVRQHAHGGGKPRAASPPWRYGSRLALPGTVALVATWLGTGALAAWGLYHAVLFSVPNDLAPDGPATRALAPAAKAAVGIAGVVMLRRLAPSAATRVPAVREAGDYA